MRGNRVSIDSPDLEMELKQDVDLAKLYQEMKGRMAFTDLENKMNAIIEQSRRETDEKPEVSQQALDYHRGYRTGIRVVFDEVKATIESGADAASELEAITSAKDKARRKA